jgi:ATP-dependent DNA helicase DinG
MVHEVEDLYRDLHGRIEAITSTRQTLSDRAVQVLDGIGLDLEAHLGREKREGEEIKFRIVPAFTGSDLWESIRTGVRQLARETAELGRTLRELLQACGRIPEAVLEKMTSVITDLRGIAGRLDGIAGELTWFVAEDEESCAWIEVGTARVGRGTGTITRLCTAPLEVAGNLRRALYERFKTVVMTSATLAVGESFDYFEERVGLSHAEPGRVSELLLASPFDFSHQAMVAVPVDIPEPGRPGYTEMVRDLVERGVLAADGRTFVLFTA